MPPSPATCKNCGNVFTGNYCNSCGEKVFTEHDKSIIHLLEEGFHFITHLEGKFFTTIKTMLTRPGRLSLDYCSGIQKKYVKPLSFFLLLVVLYLLFPIAQGLNMTIGAHVQSSLYGGYAREQALHVMSSKHLTEAYLVEHFHTASEKVSKLLLILIIPLMALWSWLLTNKRKDKLFFDHFIFSTEVNSFMVLWSFLLLPILSRLIYMLIGLFINHYFFSDILFAILATGSIGVYTFLAARRFYGLTALKSVLYTLLFVGLYIVVFQFGYKFLLFFISLKLVH